MNILFLSDNFPPESNAPASRLFDHARAWVRKGHRVTVVTCAPNFPEGKVFEGYHNRWYSVEWLEGIRVVRVKSYITANEGFARRSLDYASFMVSGYLAGLLQERPDVIVATSPQFFCAVGGWALAASRRLPFVFELRDLWPASIVAVGAMRESPVIQALEKLELFLYRRADKIVAVTEAFREDLQARGIDPRKIEVVRNGVDLSSCIPRKRDAALEKEYRLEGKFVAGYLGTHGMAHGLMSIVDAAERLRERESIAFFFAGSGAERVRVEEEVKRRGLDNVRMIPRQPKERVSALWSLCDVALIPLRNDPLFCTVIPSKLFEAMGYGIPVIASLPEGETTEIVRKEGCGLVIEAENPGLLARSLERLATSPQECARLSAAALRAAPRYSRENQATRMERILLELAKSP